MKDRGSDLINVNEMVRIYEWKVNGRNEKVEEKNNFNAWMDRLNERVKVNG